MTRRVRIRAAAMAAAAVVVVGAPAPGGAAPIEERVRGASGYVVGEQNGNGSFGAEEYRAYRVGITADAVASLVAADRGRSSVRDGLDYLRKKTGNGEVDSVGLRAKVVLAVVAGGRSARDFGGHNLLDEIKDSERPNGRYGRGTSVFDHAYAVLALASKDAGPSTAAIDWLVASQCLDGGWYYSATPGQSDTCAGDTNTTSLAVQALYASGAGDQIGTAFDFLTAARDPQQGGWGFDAGGVTDTNSTTFVIQAYAAAGQNPPDGAMKALKRLEYRTCGRHHDGEFAFMRIDEDGDGDLERDAPNLFATIPAILGLLKQPLPVPESEVTQPALSCTSAP